MRLPGDLRMCWSGGWARRRFPNIPSVRAIGCQVKCKAGYTVSAKPTLELVIEQIARQIMTRHTIATTGECDVKTTSNSDRNCERRSEATARGRAGETQDHTELHAGDGELSGSAGGLSGL